MSEPEPRLLSKFVTVCLTATDILNNMGYYSLIQLPPKRTSITKTLPFQEQLEKNGCNSSTGELP